MLCNRNAAGVLAVDYVFHLFRQLHLDFADNLAVLDYVYCDVGVYEAKHAVVNVQDVVYFDYVLGSSFLGNGVYD